MGTAPPHTFLTIHVQTNKQTKKHVNIASIVLTPLCTQVMLGSIVSARFFPSNFCVDTFNVRFYMTLYPAPIVATHTHTGTSSCTFQTLLYS